MEEEVVGKIRAVLISNKGKSDIRALHKDYKMLMGEDIPYKQLGYTSLESFVKSAPLLKVSQGPNGVTFVEAAVTNSSKHMVQLINKQKPSKKKSGGSGRMPARYQKPKTFGHTPRFQNQAKARNQSGQQWRAQYLDSARPKSHVHQIVVSVDGTNTNSLGVQQRLVKSIAPNLMQQTNVPPSRKIPHKISSPVSNTATPQISLINNHLIGCRPRMRSYNSFPQNQQQQQQQHQQQKGNTHFEPRHTAPTLSKTAIQSLLEGQHEHKFNKNPQLNMKQKSVPDLIRENTITNTDINDTCLNVNDESNKGPLAKLLQFTRTHGLGDPLVKTMHIPKAGRPFICSIKIDSETFSSYPRDCSTNSEAETEAVNNAFTTLLKRFSIDEKSLLVSTENDVLTRIAPIIECHFSGVWAEQIASDYRDKYGEQLPSNWLALLDTLPTISVEPALNGRHVLKMCKHGEKHNERATASSTQHQLSSDVSVPSNKLTLVPDGWLVEVTYVASTIEVWCRRVDTDDANTYCDMAKDLQAYYNSPGGGKEHATNVAPGGYYVVPFEGCWSRVRVLNTGEHVVTCFFIDYGDEHVVPKSDMHVMKREFARVQAQAFVCRLAGLEELANMSVAAHRLDQLVAQTYLAKPQMDDDSGVGPSAISIVLYNVNDNDNNEIGDNVNTRLIHEITADAVPTLDPHNINHVYVTHTTSKGDIYVQCHSEAFNKLNELIAALGTIDLDAEFSFSGIASNSPEVTPEKDEKTLYLARWTQAGGDGNLYRAKITDRSPCGQYICLYFIDFGNSQIIPIADTTKHVYKLEKISDVLCAFPPLATRIMLDLDRANVTGFAKRVMDLLPTDKPALLKIVRTIEDADGTTVPICEIFRRSESHNELFSVNASLKYIDTNLDTEDTNNNDKTTKLVKKLERLKSLSEQMDNNNKPVPSTGILSSPHLPEPSKYFDVCIPSAVNPWNFFVQPYEMAPQLQDLMQQLQQRYSGIRMDQLQLEDVVPGKIYASKYNDGKWYRTSVIKVINSGSISVFYCDYGYYANLTVKQLVPLDKAFLELPYQAIKARLAGIQPRDAKWSMDDCKYFEKLVHEKTFVSVVVAVQQDELYQCDSVLILRLIDTSTPNDVYIDKLLINQDIAKAAI